MAGLTPPEQAELQHRRSLARMRERLEAAEHLARMDTNSNVIVALHISDVRLLLAAVRAIQKSIPLATEDA